MHGHVAIGIDDDQHRFGSIAQIGALSAQQDSRRCAGSAQRAQFACRGERLHVALQRVRVDDVLRQVEARRVARGLEVGRVAARVRHRQRDAVFEAHRHEPAGADGQIGDETGAVRRLRKRDGRGDAREHRVFFGEPRGAEVPPAHRREHAVEARAFQIDEFVTREPRRRRQKPHVRMLCAQRVAEPLPQGGRHAMRRVEAKAAHASRGQRRQLLRPPVDELRGRFSAREVRIRDVVLAMAVARVEPRFFGLERVKPVGMLLEQRAIGGDAVDHDVEQQRHAVRAGGFGEFMQCFRRRLLRIEDRMQPVVIGDDLTVVRPSRLERRADQHMVEAERRRMFELAAPGLECSNEEGMKEIDPRRIGVGEFHRSSSRFVLPRCGCTGCAITSLVGLPEPGVARYLTGMRQAKARTGQCSAKIDVPPPGIAIRCCKDGWRGVGPDRPGDCSKRCARRAARSGLAPARDGQRKTGGGPA